MLVIYACMVCLHEKNNTWNLYAVDINSLMMHVLCMG